MLMREGKKNGLISTDGWNGEVYTFVCVSGCVCDAHVKVTGLERMQLLSTKTRWQCSSFHTMASLKRLFLLITSDPACLFHTVLTAFQSHVYSEQAHQCLKPLSCSVFEFNSSYSLHSCIVSFASF